MRAKLNERIIIGAYDGRNGFNTSNTWLAKQTNRPIITYGNLMVKLFSLMRQEHGDVEVPELIDYHLANKTDNAVILV